ncbi:carbamoyl phosphate synthase-like protein [Planctomycetes bacterium MalM25]|nr:carbamoyl phosphate synthase-like protein [Planctomycetes bacterium MalM25]
MMADPTRSARPSRLFIYEWITGGGLVSEAGALPESLLREGLAMAHAVADDAANAGHHVTLLRDLRVTGLHAPGGETLEISGRTEHDEAFERLAQQSDATLLIAPETDGALLDCVRLAEQAGATLLSPAEAFVAVASDKQRTAEALAQNGTPTPRALVLAPDDALPEDFHYPAVIKPLDGAGSQDTHLVAHSGDRPPAYAWPRRFEEHAAGVPASVVVLGVAGGETLALPPCRQRISADGRMTYLGGSTPLAAGLAERATQLALRAIEAMPTLVGLAGVDLILGDAPDGALDVVIEINPRLTTSYVGLRRAARGGLVNAMLSATRGERPEIDLDPRPLAFDADGAVYWDLDR